MHEANPVSQVIWYDSVTVEGKLEWQNELNDLNRYAVSNHCCIYCSLPVNMTPYYYPACIIIMETLATKYPKWCNSLQGNTRVGLASTPCYRAGGHNVVLLIKVTIHDTLIDVLLMKIDKRGTRLAEHNSSVFMLL